MTIAFHDIDVPSLASGHLAVVLTCCASIGVSAVALTVWSQRDRLSRLGFGKGFIEFNPNQSHPSTL